MAQMSDRDEATFGTIDQAVEALRAGRFVVVVDDEDRENEGDLVLAAETATEDWMAWTIRHTSGYICAPMPEGFADRLRLPLEPDPFAGRPVGRRVDIDRQDRDAVALGVVDEDFDGIEAHRLSVDQPDQELGRVEQLEERRLVRGPGERRGMRLREPERRERRDLPEELLGILLRHPRLL